MSSAATAPASSRAVDGSAHTPPAPAADRPLTTLIVTADDLGFAPEVNAGIEIAHREGILTAASLMVGGKAAAEAAALARRNPGLGVGLHLVLVEGRPMLPPARVPDLVGAEGCFRRDMVAAGFNFLRRDVQRQLEAEITAQFEAFAETGLPLDHVNAHKHFHLHPVIANLILRIGPRYGMRAVRAPVEPGSIIDAVDGGSTPLSARIATLYAKRLQRRLRAAGLTVPDAVFGLRWTGRMTTKRLTGLMRQLPPGLVEIYCHPATAKFPEGDPDSVPRAELEALRSVPCPPTARLTNFRCA